MKLISWNVNSLNAREELVGMFLDAEQPDVLCIQELKLPDERVPQEIFTERGYHVALHGQPRWNGVLVASKTPISAVHTGLPGNAHEDQARVIAVETAGLKLVNLYCPQGQAEDSPKFAYKLRFFDALIAWLGETYTPDEPLVVTGDINIAPEARDIYAPAKFAGVPSFHPEEHARWAQLIGWGLQDAMVEHLEPNTYSFWDYRRAAFRYNNGMRIDHFLVTPPVMEKLVSAKVHRFWRKKKTLDDGRKLTASDHAPVEITIEG